MSVSGIAEDPPFTARFDDGLRNRDPLPVADPEDLPIEKTLRLLHDVLRRPSASTMGYGSSAGGGKADPQFLADRILALPARFQIQGLLGKGGFGTVFLARDELLQRDVAIKIPHLSTLADDLYARFLRESRAVSRLNHQNIIRVLDSGETLGVLYQVSEYIHGETLRNLLNRQKVIPERQAADYVRQLADAVQHAHERKVLHRDIKPENILLESIRTQTSVDLSEENSFEPIRVPRLTDFGLARLVDDDTSLSRSGTIVGTPKYMSPEQLKGDTSAHNELSDIYSLGVVLYEMLSGSVPFPDAMTPYSRIAVIDTPVPPAKPSQRAFSKDLESIALKCLEVAQERRYPSAAELRDDLIRFLDGRPIHARPRTVLENLTAWIQRHQILTMAGALILVLGLSLIGLMWHNAYVADQQNQKLSSTLLEEQRQRSIAGELKIAADRSRLDAIRGREEFREFWWKSGIREAFGAWNRRDFAETSRLLKHLQSREPRAPRYPEWSLLKQELDARFVDLHHFDDAIREIRAIPGTQRVVAVGDTGRISVIDVGTNSIVQQIETGLPQLHALAVSADGTLVAVGGTVLEDGKSYPHIYHLPSGEHRKTFDARPTTIESLAFDHDARQLIVACRYRPISVIDLSTGQTQTIPGERRNQWVDITSDGKWLVTQELKDSVRFTELKNLKNSRQITLPTTSYFAALIPGTYVLAAAGYFQPRIDLVDLTDGQVLRTFHCESHNFSAVSVSPDGLKIFAAFESGSIAAVSLPDEFVRAVAIGSEKKATTPDSDDSVSSHLEMKSICTAADDCVTSMQIIHRGLYFAARDGAVGAIVDDRLDQRDSSAIDRCNEYWLTPDGQSIMAGDLLGQLIDVRNVSFKATINQPGTSSENSPERFPTTLLGRPGCRQSLVPDPTTWHVRTNLSLQDFVVWGQPSRDGRWVVLGGNSGRLSIYDLVNNVSRRRFDAPQSDSNTRVRCLATSKNFDWVTWIARGGVLRSARIDSDTPPIEVVLPSDGQSIAISPTEHETAVGGRFDNILVFDTETMKITRTVTRVNDCTALAYRQDGKAIFSGHRDGTIRFEDSETGRICAIRAHTSPVLSMILLEEFNLGISLDSNSDISLWYISDATLIGRLFTTGLTLGDRDGSRDLHQKLTVDQNGDARFLRTIIELPQVYVVEYRLPHQDLSRDRKDAD